MSRSAFFTRTSTATSKSYMSSLESQEPDFKDIEDEQRPLTLRDLSPRSSHSLTPSSRRASPSPPPSFYRDNLKTSESTTRTSSKASSSRGVYYDDEEREPGDRFGTSLSSSPSRTKDRRSTGGRKIMFAAPPPPIATSILLQPQYSSARSSSRGSREDSGRNMQSSRRSAGEGAVDPLLVLERRERAIGRDLQLLLDAQSAGLLQGFGGSMDEGSEAGSNTPTTRSVNGTPRRDSGSQGRSGNLGIVPVRQPKSKPIGLRGARKGLLREMGELAQVKEEENRVLQREIERRDILIRKIDTWNKRIATAKTKLSTPSKSTTDDESDLQTLREEEGSIDNEIRNLEHRLEVLRARKARVGETIKEYVNKREARLSSYRGALREAEAEVTTFLRYPPLPPSSVMGDEESFTTLPPDRRTLAMAREWWEKEQSALNAKKVEVERERAALEEGVTQWGECITEVVQFEDALRAQMKSGKAITEEDLRTQVDAMKRVIQNLDSVREKAAEKGWNLLLCAVGAEVEAFKEGRRILMRALGIPPDDDDGILAFEPDNPETDQEDEKNKESEQPPEDLLNGLDGVRLSRVESGEGERESSEDDGPNLEELMVDNSRRD